jgi:hypothetical protein
MILALLTFLAAFSIEAIGTVVSVIGLSALFGANPIIIALAVALDVGKLVVVTLLYKHWTRLGYTMRGYGLIAAVVTMTITSAGAAGYLSGEFQKAVMGVQEGTVKVDVLKSQIAKYEERKKQIDATIAAIPDRYSANQKIKLMGQYKQEQKDLQDKIAAIDKDLPALQIKQIGVEAKAGPILYISKAFNVTIEEAVKWVILLIIVVFDPLAVFLIIAGNFLWDQRPGRKKEVEKDLEEPSTFPREQVIFPTPPDRQPAHGWEHRLVAKYGAPEIEDLDTIPDVVKEPPREEAPLPVIVPPSPDVDLADRPARPVDVKEAFAEVNRPVLNLAGVKRRLRELGLRGEYNPETGGIQEVEVKHVPDPEPVRSVLPDVREVPEPEPEVLEPVHQADQEDPSQTLIDAAQEQHDRQAAQAAGMSLEEWRAEQLKKLDRIQEGVDALAESVGVPSPRIPPPAGRWYRRHDEPAREQITLSSLSKVKPDPATKTGSDDMPPSN